MSKKNKPAPQQQPISPERYIKERARKLPIDKCYLNSKIFEIGLGTALVTRKMSNGKFVVGIYMLDVFCLGLKNTSYKFNFEDFELEDLIERITENEDDFIETDYVEIHNIIHGGIAYAEDLGFKPEKDWKISEYVLEEDNDDIELIEYEFGKDGKPYYISGPYDNTETILATLRRSVGNKGFNYLSKIDMLGDAFEEDDEEEIFLKDHEVREAAVYADVPENELDNFYISLSNSSFDFTNYDEIYEEEGLEDIDVSNFDNDEDAYIYTIETLIERYPDNFNLREELMIHLYSKYYEDKNIEYNIAEAWLDPRFEKCKKAPTFFCDYLTYLVSKEEWNEYESLLGGKKHFKEIFVGCPIASFDVFIDFYKNRITFYLYKKEVENMMASIKIIKTLDPENELINSMIAHIKTIEKERKG